jgi:hypothetical protein
MSAEKFYSIVVKGEEKFFRSNRKDASRVADKLRAEHGKYNVWLRPHFRLMTAGGDIVNL